MPALSDLNSDPELLAKKKVHFEKDPDYAQSVPRRGSSRGTSLTSSQKIKKDEQIMEDLDGFFPKETVDP